MFDFDQLDDGRAASNDGKFTSEAPALSPGCRVRLLGLKTKPELNGQVGTALNVEDGSDPVRWQVRLQSGAVKLFKPENLQVCGKDDATGDDATASKPSAPRREVVSRKALPAAPLTPEEAVEWVLSASDEFEALLLPPQLEDDIGKIRRQYRQLSLLVHPDKNPQQGAEDAFKRLFGAMQSLSDPVEQRVALRRARRRAGGDASLEEPGERWWEKATVDEMEKAFREMEQRFDRLGLFEREKQGFGRASGVDEDDLWVSPEQAADLQAKDLAIFLDSRNTTDFEVSHVRGALSLPGHTMEQLASLQQTEAFRRVVDNPEQTVIVYSDNGSKLSRCVHVARALRVNPKVSAQRVLRLSGGLNLWKRHGLPVEGDPRALFAGQVLGSGMMRIG